MIDRYVYRRKKKDWVLPTRRPQVATEKEQLSGQVRGMEASSLEERFAKALDGRRKNYIFRVPLGVKGMPGWKELDFLVIDGGYYPVEIDDIEFVHRGKTAQDALKDATIREYLKEYNPQPVKRVTGDRLHTQEAADAVARELFP